MKKIVTMAAALAVALLAVVGPAQATSAQGAHRTAKPTVLAKAALVKGVRKVERYSAKHGSLPSKAKGTKMVQKVAAPKGVVATYSTVAGSRQGYCTTAQHPGAKSQKLWFHDSWLNRTWRATMQAASHAGGACAAAADQADPAYGRKQMQIAVDDANEVVDAIDRYGEQDDVSPPTTIDAQFLAAHGATLTPGSTVVGYELYDADQWLYRFCLVRDSGAWATWDDDDADITGQGTTGAVCSY